MTSEGPIPTGTHELRFEFEPTGAPDMAHGRGAPGRLQLYVDGGLVAFTGTILEVTVDVSGELIIDQEAELRAHMARQ